MSDYDDMTREDLLAIADAEGLRYCELLTTGGLRYTLEEHAIREAARQCVPADVAEEDAEERVAIREADAQQLDLSTAAGQERLSEILGTVAESPEETAAIEAHAAALAAAEERHRRMSL